MAKILIVEDEVILANDLKILLTEMSYEVIKLTGRGEAAVNLARELQPDLILMDINLGGGMDGISAAAKIHEFSEVPIIFLTAYIDPELVARAKTTSPYGYILKPFDTRELQIAIDISLYKHQLASEKAALQVQLHQAQKMEAIATFAGGVIHELNNILWAIMGFTELALQDVARDSMIETNLQRVLQSSLRAKNFIAEFLIFSHQAELEVQPLRLSRVLENGIDDLTKSLPPQISVEKKLGTADGIIYANPFRINQMLNHLYNNAVYAMRETGGTLSFILQDALLNESQMTTDPNLPDGPYFKLIISDTGQGMEKPVMDRIFEPFFTTKGVGEGKGLGLALVYGIVKGLGGLIDVSSRPGQGTAFTIFLPKSTNTAEY